MSSRAALADASKKKHALASEQDTPAVRQQRDDYRRSLEQVDVRNLVFIDEAGVHLSMVRLFGRAFRMSSSR